MIVTRTIEVRTCPAEITTPHQARPAVPQGAVIEGNEAGLNWLSSTLAYLGLIEDRLADAAKECP